MPLSDPFGVRETLQVGSRAYVVYRLDHLAKKLGVDISRMPFSVKILLESLLRNVGDGFTEKKDVEDMSRWSPQTAGQSEIGFKPSRVLLQDFTGVPAVVDLAAMRDAMVQLGGDPKKINPLSRADLVIDHSVQVDIFGSDNALMLNAQYEFERNRERYEFLRWGKQAFNNFTVVPPATGICHQVNLEFLATVVGTREIDGETVAMPDTLVGTDSHTTMINGLGVLGWGVGGIEAEAALLGQPIAMLTPAVVGVRLTGKLQPGATATDLVLAVTEMLRREGVVGKFVEYCGIGLSNLTLADRATIANMSPEYGATCGFFPVDEETLHYMRGTGRPEEVVQLAEAYSKVQGLFRTDETPEPIFSKLLELDLATVQPSVAGPRRPQDRVPLTNLKQSFWQAMQNTFNREISAEDVAGRGYIRWADESGNEVQEDVVPVPDRSNLYAKSEVSVPLNGHNATLTHGSAVIAAITSCTNTSNPSVMLAAGLLAKKAVERGLTAQPHVKTSLAPGSRVVTEYLNQAGLLPYLEQLGFHVVGYGCTTCIGNSGPVPEPIANAVRDNDLVVSAVLSGNRNFEGRINPVVRANYLASPPLVVAFALTGTVDVDLNYEPVGTDKDGKPVYLADIWPSEQEIQETINAAINADMFREQYGNVYDGNQQWNEIPVSGGDIYGWSDASTYIQNPPYFVGMTREVPALKPIENARVLAMLGDSVTTDHISPAGSIPKNSPAGEYLIANGVETKDFNSYGARRGNHEVMLRGTFGNIRLKNMLASGTEGGVTIYLPTGEQTSIYDAAMRYAEEKTPLVVFAGKEYGTGSSRDWAAKGTFLLGVRAVIAESFERIHRSNLVGMGVLPLEFKEGDNWNDLDLNGHETFTIEGIEALRPGQDLNVRVTHEDGHETSFKARARIDSAIELEYYRHGGILQYVLRSLAVQN
ncbi:MAG: aconitate hydratase AcnA [Chloroflexi bacterium AL-W]|nr:aconitate hydratase AcnA [Chloroflexi bacterium AL-N1]NOK70040.1 aconitate hydratase AcnA [Chloroflexi bacterium AL-N10]NOK77948.1 aconitate hydratase AcnA [Chloroflexi bacterium AL-N5]NOK84957.1 aconitate hydratase AcnA [Chloroflexi bacterium AL-W]NOK91936.1 aconitate hydratase AcnA [Chloroflexi bacterium AL-N15]